VPNVVDLSLTAEARRTLRRVLEERGLSFFLHGGRGHAVTRIDNRKLAWVVEAARRRARRAVRDANAVSRTRRILRREVIRRLAAAMVSAGL
jgi:predicted neutral ceramidase superfamily lipid hydrolase